MLNVSKIILSLFLGLPLCANAKPKGKFILLGDKCAKNDENACRELRIKCSADIEKGEACRHLGIAAGINGDDQGGLSYLETACEYGDEYSCKSLPSMGDYVANKERKREIEELELRKARLDVEVAEMQKRSLQSEQTRRDAESRQIDFNPLINWSNSMNPPPHPKPKSTRCNSQYNPNFKSVTTDCHEY